MIDQTPKTTVVHEATSFYQRQGLVIGTAAPSCNILHDTADTAHDHISDMLLLQQKFMSGSPFFLCFYTKGKETTANMAKNRNFRIDPKGIPNCYFHNSVFVMVFMYDEHS